MADSIEINVPAHEPQDAVEVRRKLTALFAERELLDEWIFALEDLAPATAPAAEGAAFRRKPSCRRRGSKSFGISAAQGTFPGVS